MKVAAAHSIEEAAGGNREAMRRALRERNEFGKTLAQELNGARNKMLRRMRREVREAARLGLTRKQLADRVEEIARKSTDAKRVIAWHAARAANLAQFLELRARGVIKVLISPSPSHPKKDVCDTHFGEHRLPYRLPPYHPFCTCLIVEI